MANPSPAADAGLLEGALLTLRIPGVQLLLGKGGLAGEESHIVHVPRREFMREWGIQILVKPGVVLAFPRATMASLEPAGISDGASSQLGSSEVPKSLVLHPGPIRQTHCHSTVVRQFRPDNRNTSTFPEAGWPRPRQRRTIVGTAGRTRSAAFHRNHAAGHLTCVSS
jgi:hypothetical protein